ncbi:MAG TPA: hypothetical protein VFM58_09560, partial [Solirubrobacteraceae bacterium]|nr:hypothetical protein [Solirubrobacteraceae bacterium]
IAAAAAVSLLLLAPAAWSAETLGHATSGTFPAGGPASAAFAGGPGGGGTMGGPPSGGNGGFGAAGAAPGGGTMGGPPGGGMFGGDTSSLSAAVAYADANGGGAIAVASQSGAAGSLITSGANVVAIGGFSGRESQVTTDWLADAVESGTIRYVLTTSGGGLPNDGRTGADDVMAAVAAVGRTTFVAGLYDLQGLADALRSQ